MPTSFCPEGLWSLLSVLATQHLTSHYASLSQEVSTFPPHIPPPPPQCTVREFTHTAGPHSFIYPTSQAIFLPHIKIPAGMMEGGGGDGEDAGPCLVNIQAGWKVQRKKKSHTDQLQLSLGSSQPGWHTSPASVKSQLLYVSLASFVYS